MLTRRPSYSLASLLAELSDEDLADVCADLPDLPRALAAVNLDRAPPHSTRACDCRGRGRQE